MRLIPTKLLYILVPIFAVSIFFIDSFFRIIQHFDYNINLSFLTFSLQNFRAIIVLLMLVAWVLIVRQRFLISDMALPRKLLYLGGLLLVNYVFVFLLGDILFSSYLSENPDAQSSVVSALINTFYRNIIGILAIFTLLPMLVIIRDLIFYKQRRTTRLYFNIFLVLLGLSVLWAFYNGTSLNFFDAYSFNKQGRLLNTLFVLFITITVLFLSFRNDWITYLPRKEKYIYFGIGIFVYMMIFYLREYAYDRYLLEYSYAIYNFALILSFFLLIYATIAMITLFVHLPTAKAVDRKLKEVTSLYDFARELNTERNYKKLPQLITQLTSRVLESQSAWYLEVKDLELRQLKLVSHINLTQQQILHHPFDEASDMTQEFWGDEKQPILINDIVQSKKLQYLTTWKKDARALIAAPLLSSRDQLMGIIYAVKNQPFGFDVDDISLLEGFANQAAMALENAQLWKKSLEQERLEQELKVAREVQLKLVPQTMPQIKNFEIESYFLMAYEVGGDYYDYFEYSDGKPGLVIGDVSGKGTSAAFYMAEFKGVIQTLSTALKSPKELICQANRIFYSTIERSSFVTAVAGKLIPEKRIFQFVRAGHTPILHCSLKNEKVVYLQPPGLGIGLDKGDLFEKIIVQEEIELVPGDFLVLSTDGVMEARNGEGEEFGEERLMNVIHDCHEISAFEAKDRILSAVMGFVGDIPLHDDLTFIVIKFNEIPAGSKNNKPKKEGMNIEIAKPK